MQGKPKGFVLGEYDTRAAEHGNGVVREMLGRDGREGEAHSVTVAVWVDGRLQFAGSGCRPHNGHDVSRAEARAVATVVVQRMNPQGDVVRTPLQFDKESLAVRGGRFITEADFNAICRERGIAEGDVAHFTDFFDLLLVEPVIWGGERGYMVYG